MWSEVRIISAASSAAKAKSIIHTVRLIEMEKSGRSRIRSPSARMRYIVVRKFTEPRVTAVTNMMSARTTVVAPSASPGR